MVTLVFPSCLSKVFDNIKNSIELQKLELNGASQSSLKWLRNYVPGRLQVVRMGSTLSSLLDIIHGMPQEAILSPLNLLYLYINYE